MTPSRACSFVVAAMVAALACGKNVDLGGAPDSGGFVVVPDNCDPCVAAVDCQPKAACRQIGANGFCAALCTASKCGVDEACRSATTRSGEKVTACVPTSGACTPAKPPSNVEAGTCGSLAGPTVAASCNSCSPSAEDCQRNGCYGGWWCDTVTRDCERPPTMCE